MINLTYKPSQFNEKLISKDGCLHLYNNLNGALIRFTPEYTNEISKVLGKEKIIYSDFINQEIFNALIENGLLVDSSLNEFKQFEEMNQDLLKQETDGLELIIMPTEKCNFRCTYCYEDYKKGKMKGPVIDGIKNLVTQKASLGMKYLNISYFGGEPLLQFNIIINLQSHFKKLKDKYNFVLRGEITTNGYLLDSDKFDSLIEHDINNYQITVDGLEEVHNTKRYLENGDGTFSKIMENLIKMKNTSYEFDVMLRYNYDTDNILKSERYLEYLSGYFAGDDRFKLNFSVIWKTDNNKQIKRNLICEENSMNECQINLNKLAIKYNLKWADKILLEPSVDLRCYAAKNNNFIIGSDGTIYKCTVHFDNDNNKIGFLKENGEMIINKLKLSKWTNSFHNDEVKCRTCSVLCNCRTNCCPYVNILNNDVKCPSYKNFKKTLLEL